jgi:hypothetical protein
MGGKNGLYAMRGVRVQEIRLSKRQALRLPRAHRGTFCGIRHCLKRCMPERLFLTYFSAFWCFNLNGKCHSRLFRHVSNGLRLRYLCKLLYFTGSFCNCKSLRRLVFRQFYAVREIPVPLKTGVFFVSFVRF